MPRLLAILLLLAACSGQHDKDPTAPPAPTTSEPAPAEAAPAEAAPAEAAPAEKPGQGQPCADGACADGLTCLTYYGIAGPRGSQLSSCEIPCASGKDACPSGMSCRTIADGPGAVCRP